MRDTIPDGASGYAVIRFPDDGVWQGFFTLDALAAEARAMHDLARSHTPEPAPLTGPLAAGFAALAARALELQKTDLLAYAETLRAVSTAAGALALATGERFLMVEARRDPRGGWHTDTSAFEAADIGEARELMVRHIERDNRARRPPGRG